MIIVQAPHAPRSQPRLLPVRSALLRIALSSVTRGSTFRVDRLPLTMSVNRHLAGADNARGLRFELGHTADHAGRERRHAGGLEERPASDVDALGFFFLVLLSHAKALKRKLNEKPGKYNPLYRLAEPLTSPVAYFLNGKAGSSRTSMQIICNALIQMGL